jgi:hypothetical protein
MKNREAIDMEKRTVVLSQIDKLVHELVMKGDFDPEFSPSTKIEDAMKVEQRLFELGFEVLVRRCMSQRCGAISSGEADHGDFFCNVSKDGETYYAEKSYNKSVAKTMPLAICLSAIKAMGLNDINN